MSSSGKKKKNFRILEEIYDDKSSAQSSKKSFSIKEYFRDPEHVTKVLSGAIIFFGLAALVLGFFQFKYRISKYFLPGEQPAISLTQPHVQQEDLLGLSQKDTDQDGLSDYDELYIYNSSPYLPDTDSDGISDSQEIAQRTDPNCPEGQNCFAIWTDGDGGVVPSNLPPNNDQFRAAQLREFLILSGVAEEDLRQFSDQEILDSYQQTVGDNQLTQPTTPKTVDLPDKEIEDLTTEEIRQLLNEAGVSNDILDQITDEELKDLVDETLIAN